MQFATDAATAGSARPAFASPESTVPFDRESLARYLRRYGMSFDPSKPILQFAGGLANRNYLVTVDGAQAVLRRPPEGELPPGAHDMAREHRILSRLYHALPFVPRGLHYCGDASIIGVPFQLIEYRPGLVLRGSDISALSGREDAPATLSLMLVSTLAKIQAVDPAAVGLDDLGRPDGFITRAIAGWTKRGLAVAEGSPAGRLVNEISGWLGRQSFRERRPTLLHCDFKLDNIILEPSTLAPVAVVDWDMGTRGDPLFDLATLLSYWSEPGDPECLIRLDQMPTAKPGFWSRAEAARHYAELTGYDIGDLPAMRVLCLLKLGVVFLQLHRQWVTGAVTDERYAGFDRIGADLLQLTADLTLRPE